MNKSGVALAADSAVTVSSTRHRGPRNLKTYESANKLFELIKGSNVGIMVYSSASLNTVPWETIIKCFRIDNPNFVGNAVSDYYEKLLDYISLNADLFQPSDEEKVLLGIVDWHLDHLFELLEARTSDYMNANGRLFKTRFQPVASEALDNWESALGNFDDLGGYRAFDAKKLASKFRSAVSDRVDHYYGALPFTQTQRKRLLALTQRAILTDTSPPDESGIVMAGFGQKEYFPSLLSFSLLGRLDGSVLATSPKEVKITTEPQTSGYLQTFAQDAPAMGWVYGISDDVRDVVVGHWQHWLTTHLEDEVKAALANRPTFSARHRRTAAKVAADVAMNQLTDFVDYMNKYQYREFWQPLINSVSVLPKDELGFLAESLVNLTALKQRVYVRDAKTVGGAIDVALISIGDGFVWINRKHYFDSALNPAWHLTHRGKMGFTPAEENESE